MTEGQRRCYADLHQDALHGTINTALQHTIQDMAETALTWQQHNLATVMCTGDCHTIWPVTYEDVHHSDRLRCGKCGHPGTVFGGQR